MAEMAKQLEHEGTLGADPPSTLEIKEEAKEELKNAQKI